MADWGVVGICAAGGAVVAPALDHLARTVRRPPKKAAGADADAGSTTAGPDLTAAMPAGQPSVSLSATAASTPLPPAPDGPLPALAAADLIGARAPDGRQPVAPMLPAEMIGAVVSTAGLLALAAARLGANPSLGAYGPLMAALVCLSIVDVRTGLLPRRFVYAAIAVVAVGLVAASNVDNTWHQLLQALVGGVGAYVVFALIWFIYPRGMGFGDVRLAGLCGMALGWLGYRQLYIGFFAACVLGCVFGVGFLVVAGSRRFPFGPALAAGAAVGVLWGGWLGDLWFRPG